MKKQITPNGNLRFAIDCPADKVMLAGLLERHQGDDVKFLSDLLEETGWEPNGELAQIRPEDVAALTDAPMMAEECIIEDDGTRTVSGPVWWFEPYQLVHFGQELLNRGHVDFNLAHTVD